MAHLTARSAYAHLVDRLNQFPQGAPPSDLLYRILGLLFTEREAELVALLPIRPFTAARAAAVWKMPVAGAQAVLDTLASKAILLDLRQGDEHVYVLPPPMAGFFEFSLMRVRGDVDQRMLSELLYQYITVEEDFIKALFTEGTTQLGRAFVHEPVLTSEQGLHVLDYERASAVITGSADMGVGMCYCRHKAQHVGRACDAPMDICMTFGGTARSLIANGYARRVDAAEGLDLLQQARDRRLVQFGENVRRSVAFICNCCGCCCEAMIAARKFGMLNPVHTSNFLPVVDNATCNGCGKCVNVCPVEAASLVSANDAHAPKAKRAKVDEEYCLGCGVCVRTCPSKSLDLASRSERIFTPLDSVHRTVVMAIERGDLQDLLFDNRVMWNHRALAAVTGAILKLPPIKQAMASKQMKSRYLENLIARSKA
jgi:Pyruvate/2-oxoacid:ferredoxin oxidoreductase delta subunit